MIRITYILALFLLVSCTSNTILKKPKDLIPEDQMIDLLTDLFLATGAKPIKNKAEKRQVNYMPLVFEKYQIDSARFKESNFYYTSKIDSYGEMMKIVDQRLKSMKKELKQQQYVKDSLDGKIDPLRKYEDGPPEDAYIR